MAIVSNREQILDSINIVKPSMICSVPTLFNKIFDSVHMKMANESKLKQLLFKKSLEISRKRSECLEFHKDVPFLLNLQFKLADKIIFSKIREKFGGRLQFMAGIHIHCEHN
jgi:long-chain acyl-CoA synthetase